MTVHKYVYVLFVSVLMILFVACGGDGDSSSKLSSAKAITSFSLNGVEATIVEKEKTITAVMPEGSSLSSLPATFTTTGVAVDIAGMQQISGLTMNDFSSPVIYTVTAANNTQQNYTVIVSLPPSSEKAITAFSLNGEEGIIDETTKTISLVLPFETDVTTLVATFSTTGIKVEVGAVVQASGVTVNDFTHPVVYRVTAANASVQDYIVTVTLQEEKTPATAIRVSITPNNEGTSVPVGVFCTRTKSIVGSHTVVPDDDRTIIYWEFVDNGVLRTSGKAMLGELKKKPATLLPPFGTSHTITYKATADGLVSHSASARITCGKVYAQ